MKNPRRLRLPGIFFVLFLAFGLYFLKSPQTLPNLRKFDQLYYQTLQNSIFTVLFICLRKPYTWRGLRENRGVYRICNLPARRNASDSGIGLSLQIPHIGNHIVPAFFNFVIRKKTGVCCLWHEWFMVDGIRSCAMLILCCHHFDCPQVFTV
jgi:hypothetical protein